MKAGPALSASAIFSASVIGNRSDDWGKAVTAVKRTVVSSFIHRDATFPFAPRVESSVAQDPALAMMI
jgi:hypothetical protein